MPEFRYEHTTAPELPDRARTFAGTPTAPEVESPQRQRSVPTDPYPPGAPAYPQQYPASRSPGQPPPPPQFTDSFNGNRRLPPAAGNRHRESPPSTSPTSTDAGVARAQAGLRRRSTVVASPAALVNTAVELGVITAPPRRAGPIATTPPTEREANQAAQRAGFQNLKAFKNFLIESFPPGTEFIVGATSTIAGLVEGWAARSLNITSAVAAGLKSGAEFVDALEKGDYPKAALQGLHLIGLGLNIDGAARNMPALTAAGGLVGTTVGYANSLVEQRRAAWERSTRMDTERGHTGRGTGTPSPSGSQRGQSPTRSR